MRHVHHARRYVKGDADYELMRWQIERLLSDETRLKELFERAGDNSLTEDEAQELESLSNGLERITSIRFQQIEGESQTNEE